MLDNDVVIKYMSIINPYDIMSVRSKFSHDEGYVYVTYLIEEKDLNIQKSIALRYIELLKEYSKYKGLSVNYNSLIIKHIDLNNSEYQILLGFKLIESLE